ncbi:glycoside hydrolase family 72 protein [Cercospora zeae-maydis SCOH1-5]|uniref:1,3-beta-glucanosyltransferase n=1 Tax=Cercospora zeae-maydis SCOH1-5 TaxID=717836 RepID=A0A6A6F0A5_9PEZI|nr:glycoside hydrolase family 72 protein [Cercospora zeae-maydis SCOH1-5]
MSAPSQPITIRGRYLWQGSKCVRRATCTESSLSLIKHQVHRTRRGVSRQRSWTTTTSYDPITDEELSRLRHEVALFRELGINTLLIYNIDPSQSQAQAMKLLQEAGICVLASNSPLIRSYLVIVRRRIDPSLRKE